MTGRDHLLPSTGRKLRVLGMFDGTGAMGLALERVGMEVVAHCEVAAFPCRILDRRFPHVPNLGDVTAIAWTARAPFGDELGTIDLIAGGFPCWDTSSANVAGKHRGLDGEASKLYKEIIRATEALGPRWVVLENTPDWTRWVPRVRAELADIGYASTPPLLLSAGSFGAPHRRPRSFVVAHADGEGEPLRAIHAEVAGLRPVPVRSGYWREPFAGPVRVDDGTPNRMDRLRACGNAVVPQVVEWLGQQIVDADSRAVAA